MNQRWLEHQLDPSEKEFFESNGYLIVDKALDAERIAQLLAVVDQVDERERSPDQVGNLLSVTDIVQEDPSIVELLDCPTTFRPKVITFETVSVGVF